MWNDTFAHVAEDAEERADGQRRALEELEDARRHVGHGDGGVAHREGVADPRYEEVAVAL